MCYDLGVIQRDLSSQLRHAATWAPSVTLTGPRQSGKTTLCRTIFSEHPYRSLEAPDERMFATEDPRGFLAQFPAGAVLDEVQRVPDLLSYLQGIIDADPAPGRWILTGSRNLALLESVSQSLAGRTAMHQLLPLSWDEARRFPTCPAGLDEAVFTGGYPRILDQALNPSDWLRSYVATYLERDVRSIRRVGDLSAFQRFVELCAGRTAQLLNYSSLADDCGISQPTAKAWFSILEAGYVAFHLPPFHAKVRQRLVKMPKLYFFDSGLACWLLGIREPSQLRTHPLRGALFETWVVSEVLKHRTNHGGGTGGLSFYRDSRGRELDLVVGAPRRLTLIEAKSSATPKGSLLARAQRVRQRIASACPISDLAVVYGGDRVQNRSHGRFVPWRMVRSAAPPRIPPTVRVFAAGKPVANATVTAMPVGQPCVRSETDQRGRATLQLQAGDRPVTVFVARDGFASHAEGGWLPDERVLHLQLEMRPGGGSRIVEGAAPGSPLQFTLSGRSMLVNPTEGERATIPARRRGAVRVPALQLWVAKVAGGVALLDYARVGGSGEEGGLADRSAQLGSQSGAGAQARNGIK